MSVNRFSRYTFCVCASMAIFAGCASPALNVPAGPPVANTALRGDASHGRSWMDPDAVGQELLYVSNGNGIVNVYRYWQHTLVGELTDFSQPMGECTDGFGDVYVADYGASKVVEYAHAGRKPLRTIGVSPYKPYACAVNSKNGDLAVANYSQQNYYSAGNVAIYAHAKGKPTYYSSKYLVHVNGCAFDRYGDLLAAGFYFYTSSSYFTKGEFGYLPYRSKNFQAIELPPPDSSGWSTVSGVGWDGKYWVVAAYRLYQYTINIKPQLVGSVDLDGDIGPVAFYSKDPKKQATQAVGTYVEDYKYDVYYWKYPAGGEPIVDLTHGVDSPFGVAVSTKP